MEMRYCAPASCPELPQTNGFALLISSSVTLMLLILRQARSFVIELWRMAELVNHFLASIFTTGWTAAQFD